MTENQKNIIMKLAGDPELLKAFLDMVNSMDAAPVANEATMSLYAVRRHTEDGKEFYHPIVAPRTMEAKPEDYTMVADRSVIALQNEYGMQASMMERMTGEKTIVITIPERVYKQLEEKLTGLIGAIYEKIDTAMAALDGLDQLTGNTYNAGMVRAGMVAEIMGKMTISGQCVNADLEMEDAHDYVEDHPCEDEDVDEECEGCECGCGGDCPECEDCDDYGDCPCTAE